MIDHSFWDSRRVFITGHTGFKGGWLSMWLSSLGAEVHGYALAPLPDMPSFYEEVDVEKYLASSKIGDICDVEMLSQSLRMSNAEIVFHLAAQPLVGEAYLNPLDTYKTNVIGTVNILEAVRESHCVKAVVNVTTDKVYENREWIWPYREVDPLGGRDPYSSSKACSEFVTDAYRQSYFSGGGGAQIASVRAGNVIGGGDWTRGRLVPDFLRARESGSPLSLRSTNSVRPWQFVLEPLCGYILLAERLYGGKEYFATSWNFGPGESAHCSVADVIERLDKLAPGVEINLQVENQFHEASTLKLDSSRAINVLGWRPRWSLERSLEATVAWHETLRLQRSITDVTINQIQSYQNND